ncbi:MAG: hypothetical protein AAB919_01410 [Patescibacteria group bacterium]
MKPNTIITTLAVVIVLAVLFMWGYAGKGSTAASVQNAGGPVSTSALTSAERFHDFGTISMKNGDVSYDFKVTNPTDKDILAPTLVTSCMCTRAFIVELDGSTKGPFGMPGMGYVPPANLTIPPGQSRIIRVVYNPNAHGPAGVGRIDRFAILTDSLGNVLQLEIKALVTP